MGLVTLCGLNEGDIDKIRAITNGGKYYFTVIEGEAVFIPRLQQLPDPVVDEKMYPHWRHALPHETAQEEFVNCAIEDFGEHDSPAIYISHLCAYSYTPEKYKEYAERLKSYGFDCMRSQRGKNGRFWEVWYLPFLLCAKGELEIALNSCIGKTEKEKLGVAIDYLKQRIKFGSLSVSVQKCATRIED
jgi:hypothetical protein